MDRKSSGKSISRERQEGAVLIIVALSMVALLGVAALAVDVGYMYSTHNELQNVADAAALAGARYLGSVYATLDVSEQSSHEFIKQDILDEMNAVATANQAAKQPITILIDDVEVGLWDDSISDDIYSSTLIGPDAVSVIARRDDLANSKIATFLARFFGKYEAEVTSRKAVAALSGPSNVDPGDLKTPFGISENFLFDCEEVIHFSPTPDSCAGWHNFFDDANANDLGDKLLGLIQGDDSGTDFGLLNGADWLDTNFDINPSQTPESEETPAASSGDSFNFIGGNLASLFSDSYFLRDTYDGDTGTVEGNDKNPAPMFALFDYFRYRDGDEDDTVWTSLVPVYRDEEEGECGNPTGSTKIVGFAQIVIIAPNPPPDTNIDVYIDCDFTIIEGRSGNTNYGNLKGTIPNLVK
jgi:hypothetical protein